MIEIVLTLIAGMMLGGSLGFLLGAMFARGNSVDDEPTEHGARPL